MLRRAIAIDPVENAGIAITTPSGRNAPYLPFHYLGVALARLGDCGGALRVWDISLQQGAIRQTAEFAQLAAVRGPCEARRTQARPPTAGEREPAGVPVTEPAGSPELQRAKAALAAAAAAALRVRQIPAVVLNEPRFHWDLQRAESLLEEAKRSLADAEARDDAAACRQAEVLAATARARLEQLLRQAESMAPQSAGAGPPASEVPEPGPPSGHSNPPTPAGSPPTPTGGTPATGGAPEASDSSHAIRFEWLLLGTGILLLSSMLVVAVVVPQPTPFQYVVFRTTLSLAATCVAASIPWLTSVSAGFERAGSAGGAIGVFLLVYFVDPMKRLAKSQTIAAIPASTAVPESCIFICYRRADSEDVVGRLHSALVMQFGDRAVFKDVDDIPLGDDFRKVLKGAVGTCRVILAVIGPAWDEVKNDAGQRKIDDPMDYVRFEIGSALTRDIPVIPVLVRRTALPAADRLPPELRDLVYRQAIELRPDPDFDHDVTRLVTNLSRILGIAEPQTR